MMNPTLTSSAGALFAFFSSITWATGVSIYSKLNAQFEASTINFSRALVALPCFALALSIGLFESNTGFQAWSEMFHQVTFNTMLWLALSIFSSYAFGDLLLLRSSKVIGLPSALAIASSYPIWSAISGWFFEHEALSFKKFFGLTLVVLGSIIVILYGARSLRTHQQPTGRRAYFTGVIIAFLTSMCWTLNTVAVAQASKTVSPSAANVIRMSFALILCPIFGYFISRTTKLVLPKDVFIRALPIYVFEGFCGSLFFLLGLRYAPLAIASALSSLAPVITVPIVWILGIEKPSKIRTLGVILVVIGIWNLVGFF